MESLSEIIVLYRFNYPFALANFFYKLSRVYFRLEENSAAFYSFLLSNLTDIFYLLDAFKEFLRLCYKETLYL
jgi:hypothetical protein